MSSRCLAAFLTEVKSDETLARDLRSVLISANVNDLSAVVAEFAHRKGMALDAEALLESLQASMNIASDPEFSDEELEINGSCCGFRSNCGTSCVEFRSVQLVPVFNFVD
jgi:hypothetical protein